MTSADLNIIEKLVSEQIMKNGKVDATGRRYLQYCTLSSLLQKIPQFMQIKNKETSKDIRQTIRLCRNISIQKITVGKRANGRDKHERNVYLLSPAVAMPISTTVSTSNLNTDTSSSVPDPDLTTIKNTIISMLTQCESKKMQLDQLWYDLLSTYPSLRLIKTKHVITYDSLKTQFTDVISLSHDASGSYIASLKSDNDTDCDKKISNENSENDHLHNAIAELSVSDLKAIKDAISDINMYWEDNVSKSLFALSQHNLSIENIETTFHYVKKMYDFRTAKHDFSSDIIESFLSIPLDTLEELLVSELKARISNETVKLTQTILDDVCSVLNDTLPFGLSQDSINNIRNDLAGILDGSISIDRIYEIVNDIKLFGLWLSADNIDENDQNMIRVLHMFGLTTSFMFNGIRGYWKHTGLNIYEQYKMHLADLETILYSNDNMPIENTVIGVSKAFFDEDEKAEDENDGDENDEDDEDENDDGEDDVLLPF